MESQGNSDIVKRFFGTLMRSKGTDRHWTRETINRYIFILNTVLGSEGGHISEVDLRKRIKNELERDKNHEIDKRTLRKLVETLEGEHLLKTRQFRITISQDELKEETHVDT